MMDVNEIYMGNHFTIFVSQTITMYTLNIKKKKKVKDVTLTLIFVLFIFFIIKNLKHTEKYREYYI